jgi:basic membrane lipoprotein Med (substrate-binding protein (PBP1-ABC) superfamily)
MPDAISRIAADNVRLARSRTLLNLADGTYNLIRIPKFAFVDEVYLYITTAYAGGTTGAGTVGFTGNAESADVDGFMDATVAGVRATGMKRMTTDAQPGSQGKWFQTASGMLTITLAKGDDTTLMTGWLFMKYFVLH